MRTSLRGAALMGAAAWLCLPPLAMAQQQQRPAAAVMLPSVSIFRVSTTVSVPDSARGYGRVYAGGVKYAADGAAEFGPPLAPGNRAFGSERAARGMFVSAQIHDLHDMDSLLLSPEAREARAKRRAEAAALAAKDPQALSASERAVQAQASSSGEPIRSVADIRRQRQALQDAKQEEALALVRRGEQAHSEGKTGAARVLYQMAARRAEGELKSRIESLLRSLEPATKP